MVAALCLNCASLNLQRDDFERPPFEPEGRYGSLALSNSLGYLRDGKEKCGLCGLIYHALEKNEGISLSARSDDTEWEMIWRQSNDEYDPDSSEAEDLYDSGLYPRLRTNDAYQDHCIQLVDDASTQGFLRGREIPASIDVDMIRGWIERCTKLHGETCAQSYLQVSPFPTPSIDFLVIDVAEDCLVTMPPGAKYVALSYVWGQANYLTTMKSTLPDFLSAGAFQRSRPPHTIRDAIELTRALGFQYLWVDALCIVQDDNDTKMELINSMDGVYGNASLTIIAASGSDAGAGLQGWRNAPAERQIQTEQIGTDFRLGVLPAFQATLMNTPHAQRGWTYQEGCLSPRCLVILDGKAFFSCRTSIWREDVMAEVDDVKPMEGANTLGRSPSPFPLQRFAQAVGAYTRRQLTFRSDVLNAFAGIEKAMSPCLSSTRIFYGLPAVAFDWAVLWTGHTRVRNLKRFEGFPSWAWVGWEGEILMTGDTYSSFDQRWLLERTWIDWYIILESGDLNLVWDPNRDASVVSNLITGTTDQVNVPAPEHTATVFPTEDIAEHDEVDERAASETEEDENDEEESCPTYGNPSPSNPYGRNTSTQLLSGLPCRPKSEEAELFRIKGLHPGTLVFSTVVASLKIDEESSLTTRGASIFKLRDNVDSVCGFIWNETSKETLELDEQHAEIFLLSQASPGTSFALDVDAADLATEYQRCKTQEEVEARGGGIDGEDMLGEWHGWDFFNIMLAVKADDDSGSDDVCVYERRGLGFLHKDALACALDPKPSWKMVALR